MTPGTCERAKEVVATRLHELGESNLGIQLAMHIASRGDTCFESDLEVQQFLTRSNGRHFHRESIGRKRRSMARRGLIESVRIMPQHRPPGAKWKTTHGTTSKRVLWKTIGVRNPMTRGQRREARLKQKRTEHEQKHLVEARRLRTHFVVDPEFAVMVDSIKTPSAVRRDAHDPRAVAQRTRTHQAELEERAADAKRRLAEWAEANEKRGPPE